jgi:hypothetical protein
VLPEARAALGVSSLFLVERVDQRVAQAEQSLSKAVLDKQALAVQAEYSLLRGVLPQELQPEVSSLLLVVWAERRLGLVVQLLLQAERLQQQGTAETSRSLAALLAQPASPAPSPSQAQRPSARRSQAQRSPSTVAQATRQAQAVRSLFKLVQEEHKGTAALSIFLEAHQDPPRATAA